MGDKTDNDVGVQVALRVVDLQRAVRFYQRLLGQRADAVFGPSGLALFVLDQARTRLLLDREAVSGLVCLPVDDVRRRVEELRAEGIVVEEEPTVVCEVADPAHGKSGGHEWRAFVRDTEGNAVGLVSAAAVGV